MFETYTAGFSISDGTAQIAVLEVKRRGVRLRLLDETLKGNSTSDTWYLDPLLNRTNKIYKKVRKISIALDPSSVVLHCFPMDISLSRQEQTGQLEWELSNYIPGYDPGAYVNEIKYLRTRAREQVADVLALTVPRKNAARIQEALAERKINLHAIDTAFFCAQYALLTSDPEIKTGTSALAFFSGRRIDVGILSEGHLISYRYALTDQGTAPEEFIAACIEHAQANTIFLAGPGILEDFAARLQTLVNVPVRLSNPLQHFPLSRKFKDAGLLTGKEHRFAAAIGCALIKD